MPSDIAAKCSTVIDRCYLPVTVLFFLALAYNHYQLIIYPVPLDYNEPAMQTITATVAELGNPFSIENQPARTSVYPVLYNMLVAPLSALFGNTLPLHRLVNGIFLVASCLLVFFAAFRVTGSARDSFAASSLFYAGLLFYATPIASATGLGLFLFLCSLLVPWYHRFSNHSLGIALALGIVAFFCKQYFVASLGYISLYLFLSVSKLKGILFGLLFLICFTASIVVTHHVAPYFLDITVFSGSIAKFVASNEILLDQMRAYGLVTLPLLLILLTQPMAALAARPGVAQSTSRPRGRFLRLNLNDPGAPLLSPSPDYFWLCFACSLAVIVFILGKSPGNFLSYHFQLISPFLLIVTLAWVSRAARLKAVYQLLVLVAYYTSYDILSHDFSVRKPENWKKLEQVVAGAKKVYATPIILETILENGGEIYQNGHTFYFYFASDKPAWMEKDNPEETTLGLWEKHIDRINAMIEAQEFDLIILDRWTKIPQLPDTYGATEGAELLAKYYRLRETIPVYLAPRRGGGLFRVKIWEPIPQSAAKSAPVPAPD